MANFPTVTVVCVVQPLLLYVRWIDSYNIADENISLHTKTFILSGLFFGFYVQHCYTFFFLLLFLLFSLFTVNISIFFHSHFRNSRLNCDPTKVNYRYKLCQVVCQLYDSLKFEEGRKPVQRRPGNNVRLQPKWNTASPFLSPPLQIIHVQSAYWWILYHFSISHLVFCYFKSYCTHNILITEIWKLDDLVKKSLTGEETLAVAGFAKVCK